MARFSIEDTTPTAIADSIRSKTGKQGELIAVKDMAAQIEAIEGGGGGSSAEGFHDVTFMNGSEEPLTRPVYDGDDCPDPVTQGRIDKPTKESTVDTVYTHNGWAAQDGSIANKAVLENIEEDRTVFAAFKSDVRKYTIRFLDVDGTTELQKLFLAYGETPMPDTPIHTTDPDHYIFDSWSPALSAVTDDADYMVVWKEKKALRDHTWAELEAMSIDEMREKFVIGEKGPDLGGSFAFGTHLVAFEHDDLADGAWKARMTFTAHGYLAKPDVSGMSYQWGEGRDWSDCWYREYSEDTVARLYPEIMPYVKPVTKKYVATDGTIKEVVDKYFAPSLSELGYVGVPNDGVRYEYFSEKALTEQFTLPSSFMYYSSLGFVRTIDSTTGKVYALKTKVVPTLYTADKKYTPNFAFCI